MLMVDEDAIQRIISKLLNRPEQRGDVGFAQLLAELHVALLRARCDSSFLRKLVDHVASLLRSSLSTTPGLDVIEGGSELHMDRPPPLHADAAACAGRDSGFISWLRM